MLTIDHLAVSARTLAEGVAHVEQLLGVELAPGGAHPAMGTHNRLLRLCSGLYLEVIAVDPSAPPPGRPRWFDLDNFSGPPRLTNWIARCPDLDAAIADAPAGIGVPLALSRGKLSWRMAVPEDGKLPFEGGFPALIEWQGSDHPAAGLPDRGCRLVALEISHPDARALRQALAGKLDEPRLSVSDGKEPGIRAIIETPSGRRVLR